MKKKKWLLPVSIAGGFILLCILLLIVTVCIIGIKGYGISKGRLYFAEKHTYLIDDRDMAMLVSDQSKKGTLFQGYVSGDEVLIVHDGVEETYPAKTGAYHIIRISKGDGTYKPTDEVLGIQHILTETHSHQPAAEAQTVSDPISGYCGNTQTTIYFDNSSSYNFMYGKSVTLSDLLVNLAYNPDNVCTCETELRVDTEFGKDYFISLSEGFVRCDKGQVQLTKEQNETVKEIIEWAKECAGFDNLLYDEREFEEDYLKTGTYTIYKDIIESIMAKPARILVLRNDELVDTVVYSGADVIIEVSRAGNYKLIAEDEGGNQKDITTAFLKNVKSTDEGIILFLD